MFPQSCLHEHFLFSRVRPQERSTAVVAQVGHAHGGLWIQREAVVAVTEMEPRHRGGGWELFSTEVQDKGKRNSHGCTEVGREGVNGCKPPKRQSAKCGSPEEWLGRGRHPNGCYQSLLQYQK